MNDFATRFSDSVLMSAGAVLVLGGCLSIAEPRQPLLWEGPFAAVPGATLTVTGMAYMAAMEQHTDAAIGVVGDPDIQLAWSIRNGPCSGSGNLIAPAGVFPSLVISVDGMGEAESRINRRVEQGTYSVEVFAGDLGGERLACADLLPRS
jgi:hypothetical protein